MKYNNKVYANADEKYVKNTILYANYLDKDAGVMNSGSYLFHDEYFTKPVLYTEIETLFLNGFIIEYGYGSMALAIGYEPETLCISTHNNEFSVLGDYDELFHRVK